jgi:hypothetical protein
MWTDTSAAAFDLGFAVGLTSPEEAVQSSTGGKSRVIDGILLKILMLGRKSVVTLPEILSAIPEAAKSDRALVAYGFGLTAWVVVAYRVNRNKNLLNRLEKLPKQDRLTALQEEMGRIRLKEGMSPQEYLQAQKLRYYFLGGLALLAVMAIVFLLASFLPRPQAKVQNWPLALVPIQNGKLTDAARETLEKVLPDYQQLREHKALAISNNGHTAYLSGLSTKLIAEGEASKECQRYAGGADDPCFLVMIDSEKVGNW